LQRRGEHAVPGGVVVEEHDVAGLLAAEIDLVAQHRLDQ
jgi:hypothetical protein